MKKSQPIFDPATNYRIEIQGRIDLDWLQSFESSVEIIVDETRQMAEFTVLNVHADQSGMVGLVRRLHGLGITILQLQIVSDGG